MAESVADRLERAQQWHSEAPPKSGYYLGAWWNGRHWIVSELWFNESNGWWPSRGYFPSKYASGAQLGVRPIPVRAWMHVPTYAVVAASEGEK